MGVTCSLKPGPCTARQGCYTTTGVNNIVVKVRNKQLSDGLISMKLNLPVIYLVLIKIDSGIMHRLRHPKTFRTPTVEIERFRKTFIPYCLRHYQ